MIRRFIALLAALVVLGACQVDVQVDIAVEPDGTGTITVITTANGLQSAGRGVYLVGQIHFEAAVATAAHDAGS